VFRRARHFFVFWARSIQPTLLSYLLKIRLNSMLPFTPRFSNWSFFFRFPYQNPANLPTVYHMPRPSHPSYLIT